MILIDTNKKAMKNNIVNYEAKSLPESLGLTEEQIEEKVNSVIDEYIFDSDKEIHVKKIKNVMEIFQIVAEKMSYRELVFITGHSILQFLEKEEDELRKIIKKQAKKQLKNLNKKNNK